MDAYFNENRVVDRKSVSHNDWEKRLEGMKIRSNLKDEIILLARYDKDMQKAITMDDEYTKEVTFAYLEEILGIKRSARERRYYRKLIETLGKLGITLVIQ